MRLSSVAALQSDREHLEPDGSNHFFHCFLEPFSDKKKWWESSEIIQRIAWDEMSRLHVHDHAACPGPWSISLLMVHVHFQVACPFSWRMSMS